MSQNNLAVAESYYKALSEKNVAGMEKYLHPDVQFFSPAANLSGKAAVLQAAEKLIKTFASLSIRAKFGSGEQAVLILDLNYPEPVGHLPSASLLTFNNGLIKKIELFLDGRILERKKSS